MPGLKQAALLAYEHLKNCLKPYGYEPIPGTAGLWKHKHRPTVFCLCVDDFGIKYWSQKDADHICNSIGANFRYTVNKEGNHYCGLSIKWNYSKGYVDILMPKYVLEKLKNFCISKGFIHNIHRISIYQYNMVRKGINSLLLQRIINFFSSPKSREFNPSQEVFFIMKGPSTVLCCLQSMKSPPLRLNQPHIQKPNVNNSWTTQPLILKFISDTMPAILYFGYTVMLHT